MEQIKILTLAPTPFFASRGTHIRILEEAKALQKRGYQVDIATYHIGEDTEDLRVFRIPKLLFWYKKTEAGPSWQKIILDGLLFCRAFHLLLKNEYLVIHAHLHEGVLLSWALKKTFFWRNIILISDFHGSLHREMTSHNYLRMGFVRKIFAKIEKEINKLGDISVASSKELATEIKKDNPDVFSLLDGVNQDDYRKAKEKSKIRLREKYELPGNKIIFVYAGALLENKGVSYLLEAVREISQENGRAFFLIAGYPIKEVKKFVQENRLEDSVKILSPLSYFELPEILSACDVGIDPKDSQVRQASGKILQYMAAGLPVVCFKRPNNENYLEKSGFYSGNISAKGIEEGIRYFLQNPGDILKKSAISTERSKQFSWDNSISALDEKIKNVLPKA